jgi:hypothetical protein
VATDVHLAKLTPNTTAFDDADRADSRFSSLTLRHLPGAQRAIQRDPLRVPFGYLCKVSNILPARRDLLYERFGVSRPPAVGRSRKKEVARCSQAAQQMWQGLKRERRLDKGYTPSRRSTWPSFSKE